MKPPRSILDPSFAYTAAAHTDLKKTFDRLKREAKAKLAAERKASEERPPAIDIRAHRKGAI